MSKKFASLAGITIAFGLLFGLGNPIAVNADQGATTYQTFSTHDRLVNEISSKHHSGYLYDGSSENGGYRWFENGDPYTGLHGHVLLVR